MALRSPLVYIRAIYNDDGEGSPLNELFKDCTGFDWDAGNVEKNWEHHRVSRSETEQVFFGNHLLVARGRPVAEERYHALGQTARGRRLSVVFSIRGSRVRVISARDMSRNERREYASS